MPAVYILTDQLFLNLFSVVSLMINVDIRPTLWTVIPIFYIPTHKVDKCRYSVFQPKTKLNLSKQSNNKQIPYTLLLSAYSQIVVKHDLSQWDIIYSLKLL